MAHIYIVFKRKDCGVANLDQIGELLWAASTGFFWFVHTFKSGKAHPLVFPFKFSVFSFLFAIFSFVFLDA